MFVLVVEHNRSWSSGADDHFVAVAEYDFEAQNGDELTFKQGTLLNVAPKGLPLVNVLGVLTCIACMRSLVICSIKFAFFSRT